MGSGKRQVSILVKLIVTFLIVIAPMYGIGAAINSWGGERVRSEVYHSLQSQESFYLMSFENEIKRMENLLREYVNDEDLVSLGILPDSLTEFQKLGAFKRLQQRLIFLKESSIYISRVSVYIPPIGKTVSNESLAEELTLDRLGALKSDLLQQPKPLFYRNEDRYFLREYYPNSLHDDKRDPMFVLELELSLPELQRYLASVSNYAGAGGAILQGESALVHTGDEEAYAEIGASVRRRLASAVQSSPTADYSFTETMRSGGERYLTVSSYSAALKMTLLSFIPERAVLGTLDRYRIYLWLISAVALVVIVVFSYYMYRLIHRPLSKLVRAFGKVESGDLQVAFVSNRSDEFQYLFDRFNGMVARLNTLIYEVYEQKISAQTSELKQLQSQINPHFLYNSFYLLYRMTRAHDFDNSTRFTKYLGDYFQYMTRTGSQEVTLANELSHARVFADIQSIRFRDRIVFHMEELPAALADIVVPRLILQPFVENVYQHGFSEGHEGRFLSILFEEKSTGTGRRALDIVFEDNGKGMDDETLDKWQAWLDGTESPDESTGMYNVHRRLNLRFGADAGVAIYRREGGGLRVAVRIPIDREPGEGEREYDDVDAR
ncbi:sensor histidine kinase [Cohnella sp. GCM10012308]|uniref:sensor histidine kinase n=1 Tax=Cohnella sp. GCM10012308 TaxID=3317329 RepID=UPI003613F899